ncbi:MAG: ATP-binding protein [Bacteroidales bacterium]
MENLIQKSKQKSKPVADKKKRYLFELIDWKQRLIIILGYRGTGKTTLILQYLSSAKQTGVYLSLDDFFFETHRLVETVQQLYVLGYRLFLLDEVHRYMWWSKDLKQLYDDHEDIQLIATGSSILDISKGNTDLSRRAVLYNLPGLSFREYLYFYKNINIPVLSLHDIINKHHIISADLLDLFNYEKDFRHYLEYGYYPFFLEGTKTYFQKLQETINLVIDTDIAPFEELQYSTTRTMKKLLYVISQSVPFTPNINKLSQKLETPRNTVLRLLDYMGSAQILLLLKSSAKGNSYLQKPEKIYLQNTNFMYLFSHQHTNIGNLRETFFFNQLSVVHNLSAAKFGDFMVDDTYVFEIGGAAKTNEQIKGIPNAYLALDIENGNENRIPLWMFGMLH